MPMMGSGSLMTTRCPSQTAQVGCCCTIVAFLVLFALVLFIIEAKLHEEVTFVVMLVLCKFCASFTNIPDAKLHRKLILCYVVFVTHTFVRIIN